ncbi:hypothetical protein [Shinella oryzae]|uniref:Uncharacterized protein n=1 Tax=Shinella oryzae TaxID=2871820 RepID=A0ABY9KCR3_9HYPH|nr:hypothetical protein [Shinella oryzae]WLS04581.1 hypothetical protein Q9315_08235 [Shinella oryzae]
MARKSTKRFEGTFDFTIMGKLPKTDPDKSSDEKAAHEVSWADERERADQRREELIRLVHGRALKWDEAEHIALTEKIGPLASRLGNVTELTFDMTIWTFEMVASWISTQDPKLVHRHYKPSYEGKRVWKRLPPARHPSAWVRDRTHAWKNARCVLVDLEAAHFEDRTAYVDLGGKIRHFPALKDFFPTLRMHLLRGEVQAFGEAQSPAGKPDISPSFWAAARFDVTAADGACLSVGDTTIYRRILFRAPGLLSHYPPLVGSRIRPGKVYPWKRDIAPSAPYKNAIVDRLRAVYPKGLPDWQPKKNRDAQLREALGKTFTERWRIPPSGWVHNVGYKNKEGFKDDAFRVAMDRILKESLEKQTIEIDEFY